MTNIIPLSVTSIKIVETELNATLQNACSYFEAFLAERNAVEQLAQSAQLLQEIVGVIRVLELPGALQLAEEMHVLLEKMQQSPQKISDIALNALSQAFVVLPAYIEYVIDKSQAMPVLLVNYINELRLASRKGLLFESELAHYAAPSTFALNNTHAANSDIASLVKRQRQMYQMGLIGLLRQENQPLKLQLMHRAMQRLADGCGAIPIHTQWRLGEALLEALLSDDLQLDFTRQRVLAQLDGLLRQFEQSGFSPELQADSRLLTELAYLIKLSRCTHTAAQAITTQWSLPDIDVTEQQIVMERAILQGPNAQTIQMMVSALREDLAQCKEQLEVVAQEAGDSVDFAQMADIFARNAQILAVTGLVAPSRVLNQMQETVKAWTGQTSIDMQQLQQMADDLLFVDSVLGRLNRFDLHVATSNDEESRQELMAKSQLDEALTIVVQEALTGLNEAKKEINSYVESHYERSHIDAVLQVLEQVRGAAYMLDYPRAAIILKRCVEAIARCLPEHAEEERIQEVLQTIADALIALEYYLSEIQLHDEAPENALVVAEQSLASLQ